MSAISLDSSDSINDIPFDQSEAYAVDHKSKAIATRILDLLLPRNVVTGSREFHLIPTSIEKFLGSALYPLYLLNSGGRVLQEYQRYNDMVQRIGKTLAAHSPRSDLNFEFAVVNDRSLNAWCLPGGKIAINLGLLFQLENERDYFQVKDFSFEEKVAAVLSHEITHATARHFGRTMELRILLAAAVKASHFGVSYLIGRHYDPKIAHARSLNDKNELQRMIDAKDSSLKLAAKVFNAMTGRIISGIGLCKSRAHELEADRYGMFLMSKVAQYSRNSDLSSDSPKAAIWLHHFFIKHTGASKGGFFNWLRNMASTHPSPHERLEANTRTWQEIQHSPLQV